MHRHFPRIFVLLLALLASSNPPTMAGYYSGYASIDTFVSVADGPNSSFSIIPGTNERATGSATGNASYSNNVTYGLNNSLPPPLFPGVYNSSQTSGFAGLPAGSSASSSITIESETFLTFSAPTILAFDVVTSTITSVQTTAPYEFADVYADANVYFDGSQVYGTSSTAGSFGNGLSYTTTSGGASPIIYVLAHAGINELDSVTYTNGDAYTITPTPPPPPASVPEPSSLLLVILGASTIALVRYCLGLRRRGRVVARMA